MIFTAYSTFIATILVFCTCFEHVKRNEKHIDLAFVTASFVAIIGNRFQFFSYAAPLNVDEALFAANAMRSFYGWTNWGIIDPTTSGPLNSIVLTWPHIFGGDITLYSGRLTAAVFACGTSGFIYASARRVMAPIWAIVASTPCILFYATARGFDFVQFSSEQLPVFLIAGSIYFLIRAADHSTLFSLAMATFLAGLVPLAKLQGLPWATLLALAALIIPFASSGVGTRKRQLFFVATTLAAILPAAFFLLPLLINGDFDDFFKSYLLQQFLRPDVSSDPLLFKLAWQAASVRALIVGVASLVIVSAVIVAFNINPPYHPLKPTKLQIAMLILSLLALPIAFVSIGLPRRNYHHYLQFLVPVASLWAILATSIVASLALSTIRFRAAVIMISCAGILPTLIWAAEEQAFTMKMHRADGALLTGGLTAPRSLSWLRPMPSDTVVCWGWQPSCYVESAISSATRDATNENQIYRTSLLPYFRSRFIADFQRSRPDFVIDFVAPGGGFSDAEQQSIGAFSDFDKLIKTEFDLMSRVDPVERCPRLYVRKPRANALSNVLVEFARVEGPSENTSLPAAVDDRSTFETCADYWLLPEHSLGTLTISFRKPSSVKSVAILNTANGFVGDRATDRIRLLLLQEGQIVATKETGLNRFPRWTNIEFDTSDRTVNSMQIEILSYFGTGGGLNEVKVYTDQVR
jgi:hypothetical protein